MRVTAFLGLYWRIREGWPEQRAFALLRELWQPDVVWADFIAAQLANANAGRCAVAQSSNFSDSYVLGHSDKELARLNAQARLIDPITRQFLVEAGIAEGMRVLDVGSGAGHVAVLAAQLVGDTGEVVGADTAPTAIARARARAEALSLDNVSFREGDPAHMRFDQSFDAVIGRYVLMFQPDPTLMLHAVARHARSGAVIAFHEPDWAGVRSYPPITTYDECCRWIVETMRLRGADMRMGIKLFGTFVAAGLPAPSMRLQSVIAGGSESRDQVRFKTDLAETLAAEIERLGVANASQIGIETLAERIANEVVARGSVIVGRSEICAWCRAA
jgi:SAM-dependent methyltransferase